MEYMLETKGIVKKYGKHVVLNGVDINVPKGAVYGLIGKNGAGKTTFMRVVTNLIRKNSGEYKIGCDKRKLSAVIEAPGFYEDLSVVENIKAQYRIRGIREDENEMNKIITAIGLDDARDKMASRLSLGMKQRLGIGMALVGDAELVILDEPMNGLDPQGIVDIRNVILALNKEKGITFIISSHLLEELSKVATMYGFLDDGKIVKELSKEELMHSGKMTTKIGVSDVNKMAVILDNMNLEYRVLDHQEIIVYKEISLEDILPRIQDADIKINSLTVVHESIESVYTNVMSKGENK